MAQSPRLAAVLLLTIAFVIPGRAASPSASVDLRTTSGETTFRIGERIPLRLTFSSTDDTTYQISPVVDPRRAEEFDCNSFIASPAAGWSDPLATYFKQEFFRTGHGWGPHSLPRRHPVEAILDLNQWIRFDRPGDYTVTLTSDCVFPKNGNTRHSLRASIALHIVAASGEWQAQKLNEIRDHWAYRQPEKSSSDWELAVRDLRYLATPQAIDEMTFRLRELGYFSADECHMGLVGLPPDLRQTAIDSMNRRIEEPNFPVSELFFSTLSFLHVVPGSEQQGITEQLKTIHPVLWAKIYSAVWNKQHEARAQTVQTLLWYQSQTQSTDIESKISSLLQTSFLDLDQSSQIQDLRNSWDLLNTPAFLPVLQSLARLPDKNPEDGLKGLTLMRWYQLDPQGAHSEILAQIGTATPSLRADSLAFLPAEQLPQFESLWADAFLATQDQLDLRLLGGLLVRFGSGAVADRMLYKLSQPGKSLCDAHLYSLAYLARFRPETALPLLRKEIDHDPAKCDQNILSYLTQIVQAPAINDLAVAELDNPNSVIVRDAVDYLQRYGRLQDRAPLWNRYVRWEKDHSRKPGTLSDAAHRSFQSLIDFELGEMLGDALIANQGWFASRELAARVLAHCTTKEACTEIKQRLDQNAEPYQIVVPDTFTFNEIEDLYPEAAAQYQTRSLDLFEQKIAQFPPGSHFTLLPSQPRNGDQRKLVTSIAGILKKYDMILEPPLR